MGSDNTRAQNVILQEAKTLGELGAALREQQIPRIPVRIPRTLAETAVAAWQRDAGEGGTLDEETFEERIARQRAGTLALIGIAVEERGQRDSDCVVVDLHPEQIGVAMDAADEL
ncbi:hypothetical protein [Brevibacterium marinum]|uniref:Uncharacterized protein n=1 Tax=Brevibacterium marinum TaxID=418643 RepID=A0A846RS02_9MICO|nr:hypothetical protein [Brevibacterium marinum]NJC56539.1 hypothetical protein [Brevibacterium marinum]